MYERILAEDIRPGDKVARARTHTFYEVSRVEHHPTSVSIYYVRGTGSGFGGKDRPRRTAKWWVEREQMELS